MFSDSSYIQLLPSQRASSTKTSFFFKPRSLLTPETSCSVIEVWPVGKETFSRFYSKNERNLTLTDMPV